MHSYPVAAVLDTSKKNERKQRHRVKKTTAGSLVSGTVNLFPAVSPFLDD